MTLDLIPKEDCTSTNNNIRYGKFTRYKRCHKCGTTKINIGLTETVKMTTRYGKRYLCDQCDKIF
jgi:predicted RNA-binding Zn-ribbon protein involved in translation (DUF1610 family)